METISRIVLTFLVNALWQAPLLACVGALCARMMRRAPARFHHDVWAMALAACLLLPAASVARHYRDDAFPALLPSWSSQSPAPEIQSGRITGGRDPFLHLTPASGLLSLAARALTRISDFLNGPSRSIPLPPLASLLALACYALSLAFHGVRFCRAWRKTKGIARSGHACEMSPGVVSASEDSLAAYGLDRIRILVSSQVAGPVTLGIRRPVIILPERMIQEISLHEARSIFAHEMEHIHRRDYLKNLFCEIASLPVAFHPAVSLIKRRINETREMACDEAAAGGLPNPVDYAQSLVTLARRMSAASQPSLAGHSLGISDANILEERIIRILDMKATVRVRPAKITLALGVFLLAASCLFASAISFSVNQAGALPADALQPWVGTWVAKLKGRPMTRVVLRLEGSKASGTITSFHVTLDDLGQPVEAGDEAHVWQIQAAKAEGKTLELTAADGDGPAHEFQLVMTGAGEARFTVVGAPPPPGASEDEAGLKMVKEVDATGLLPNSFKPFVGTWQAMFEGKAFTTLRLLPNGAKLAGSMSPCRIEMDANGKLTHAERKTEGPGWQIIEATLEGSKLKLKAKEDGSEDVDEFEMKLTGENAAEFKPVGAPMPVEPWKMTRGEIKNGSGLLAPAPNLDRQNDLASASRF